MQEEYHGNGLSGADWKGKLLYGWGTLHVNIWLPSLSELVGITGTEHPNAGTYKSAMQGLNTSNAYCVDTKGGEQLAYFQQFNTAEGGEAIMNACNQDPIWLRSTCYGNATDTWRITNTTTFDVVSCTRPLAVHPAAGYKFKVLFRLYPPKGIKGIERSWGRRPCSSEQVPYRSLIPKGQGKSSFTTLFFLSTKRHGKSHGSFVNALARALLPTTFLWGRAYYKQPL